MKPKMSTFRAILTGASYGLCGAVIVEFIRWLIEDDRTLGTMLWSSWLIVLGAVVGGYVQVRSKPRATENLQGGSTEASSQG